MTKKDIVKVIAAEMNLSQGVVHTIVQRTFDGIIETLLREKRIELRNFGVFEVRVRAPRKARNPRTNQHLDVPERSAVTFKPGKEMAEKIATLPLAEVQRAARGGLEAVAAEEQDEPQAAVVDTTSSQPQRNDYVG